MTTSSFFFVVLALLIAPGPTNTLMAVACAQEGVRRLWHLIPAEILGYLVTIVPSAWYGAMLFGRWPLLAIVMKLVAVAWVVYLAAMLWRRQNSSGTEVGITARRVFVTTALNPKALVFAFVLLPPTGDPTFIPRAAQLCACAACVALLWGAIGAWTNCRETAALRMLIVRRAASVWLTTMAGTLLVSTLPL